MGLQSFDFFRKIQSEQELSSSTGGIFTIGSLIVASILILLSIRDFTTAQYVTSLVVRNDPTEYLTTKIDITFDQAPCELITISFHDQLEYLEPHIEKKLNLMDVLGDQQTAYTAGKDREENLKKAKEGIENKRKCRIFGTFNLPKTPGILTFDTSGPEALINALTPQERNKVKAGYLLQTIQFGNSNNLFDLPISHRSKALQQYVNGLEGDIKTRTFLQDFRDIPQRYNFYNHLKIIPFTIDDGSQVNENEKQKYRFSLRAGRAATNAQAAKLEINTEIEPINIVYKKYQMTVYELAVDILAIVGGSVATIGVINSISHFLIGIK